MRPLLSFLGLLTVGVLLLSYLTAGHCRVSVESALTTEAQSRLAAAGLSDVRVRFDYLDAILEGNVSGSHLSEQAALMVSKVDGARMLLRNNRLRVVTAPAHLTISRRADDLVEVLGRVSSQRRADGILAQVRAGQPGVQIDNQLEVDAKCEGLWWGSAEDPAIRQFLERTSGVAALSVRSARLLANGAVANGHQARELKELLSQGLPSDVEFDLEIAVAASLGATPVITLTKSASGIELSGRVPYASVKESIVSSVQEAVGDTSVEGELSVDKKVGAAPWLTNCPPVLQTFLETVSEGQFQIDGSTVVLSGNVDSVTSKDALGQAAQRSVGLAGEVSNQLRVDVKAVDPIDATLRDFPAPVREKVLTETFQKNAVYFASGSKALSRQDKVKLRAVAAAVKREPAIMLWVGGYADSTGNAAANRQLSLERAEVVKAALISMGVSTNQLMVESFGAETVDQGEVWKSRRVELSIR